MKNKNLWSIISFALLVNLFILGCSNDSSKSDSTISEDKNIPENISAISQYAFTGCSKLTTAEFEKKSGWYVSTTENATSGTDLDLSNHSTAADYLGNKYATYYWYCN